MQRKVSRRVQRIHYQLTGPAIAVCLKFLTSYPRPLCRGSRHVCTEFSEQFPWPAWHKL